MVSYCEICKCMNGWGRNVGECLQLSETRLRSCHLSKKSTDRWWLKCLPSDMILNVTQQTVDPAGVRHVIDGDDDSRRFSLFASVLFPSWAILPKSTSPKFLSLSKVMGWSFVPPFVGTGCTENCGGGGAVWQQPLETWKKWRHISIVSLLNVCLSVF
jgi:hypothetical protein